MKIVCLGDSLTRGYGITASRAWVSLVSEKLGITMINRGISGDTTGGMLSRFEFDVVSHRPDYVLLMGGGNDFRAGCPPYVAQSNMMAMIHQAQSKGVIPIVGLAIPSDTDNLAPHWISFEGNYVIEKTSVEYRKWLTNFCETFSIALIDFYQPFKQHFESRKNLPLFLDGLHPNADGHVIMADIAANKLEEIIKKTS